jgi:hypothetical protein
MDTTTFDRITRLFGARRSRRSAITGSLGLTAAGLITRAPGTAAQQATPEVGTGTDPHPSADAPAKTEFLFVQHFTSGTWAPKAGVDATYVLTLTGASAQTVYFSDRPERVFGLAPTQGFLDGLGFTAENPPNAAVVARRADSEEQEVLVVELLNPAYDAEAGTLAYDAKVLADYGEPGLAHAARRQADYELGESFAEGGLFIDDCPSVGYSCTGTDSGQFYGYVMVDECFTWTYTDQPVEYCAPCDDPASYCATSYPDQCAKWVEGGEDPAWKLEYLCTAG